jgi:murein DD-endopeptidase MepM/ murein hydrolase activator NlpD
VPSHAVRRRPALPALLLTVAAAALGGLALLPSARPATTAVLSAAATDQAAVTGSTERADVLGRPPVLRTVARPAVRPPVKRPVPKRASRLRVDISTSGYACPVAAPTTFTDSFGAPRPGGRRHQGTDVLAAYGAPVVAVTSGVIRTNYSSLGGISLYLEGSDGNEYFYAHNSRNVATTGEHVQAGQLIGYVGNTGDARGGPSHVHFELHPHGGRAVDSYLFLRQLCG